jgi:hypothetical protein
MIFSIEAKDELKGRTWDITVWTNRPEPLSAIPICGIWYPLVKWILPMESTLFDKDVLLNIKE